MNPPPFSYLPVMELNRQGDWILLSWGGNHSRKKRIERKSSMKGDRFRLDLYTVLFCHDCAPYNPHKLWDTWRIGINLGLGYFTHHHEVEVIRNCEKCSILKKYFVFIFLLHSFLARSVLFLFPFLYLSIKLCLPFMFLRSNFNFLKVFFMTMFQVVPLVFYSFLWINRLCISVSLPNKRK